MKCFIVRDVIPPQHSRRVHMMNVTGLIFRERVFVRCYDMGFYRRKKSSALNPPESPSKGYNRKEPMNSERQRYLLAKRLKVFFHFTRKRDDSVALYKVKSCK